MLVLPNPNPNRVYSIARGAQLILFFVVRCVCPLLLRGRRVSVVLACLRACSGSRVLSSLLLHFMLLACLALSCFDVCFWRFCFCQPWRRACPLGVAGEGAGTQGRRPHRESQAFEAPPLAGHWLRLGGRFHQVPTCLPPVLFRSGCPFFWVFLRFLIILPRVR